MRADIALRLIYHCQCIPSGFPGIRFGPQAGSFVGCTNVGAAGYFESLAKGIGIAPGGGADPSEIDAFNSTGQFERGMSIDPGDSLS
jgi:hypothetical protein